MKTRVLIALFLSLLLVVMAFGACAKTTTTTVTMPLTVPAKTVTLPAVTSVLPAVTVTLPSKVTTIPATTVKIPSTTTVVPATTVSAPPETPAGFLPDTPSPITGHMSIVVGDVKGDCLQCHGPNGAYNTYPMAPDWDGTVNNSAKYTGFYWVVAGSIQDHTGRTDDTCLTCHAIAS